MVIKQHLVASNHRKKHAT